MSYTEYNSSFLYPLDTSNEILVFTNFLTPPHNSYTFENLILQNIPFNDHIGFSTKDTNSINDYVYKLFPDVISTVNWDNESWLLLANTVDQVNTIRKGEDPRAKGTFVLCPPNKIKPYTGGDFILRAEGVDRETIISPSTFTEWTLVYVPSDIKLTITPILSGTQYIFSTDLLVTFEASIGINKLIPITAKEIFQEESKTNLEIQAEMQRLNDQIQALNDATQKIIAVKVDKLEKEKQGKCTDVIEAQIKDCLQFIHFDPLLFENDPEYEEKLTLSPLYNSYLMDSKDIKIRGCIYILNTYYGNNVNIKDVDINNKNQTNLLNIEDKIVCNRFLSDINGSSTHLNEIVIPDVASLMSEYEHGSTLVFVPKLEGIKYSDKRKQFFKDNRYSNNEGYIICRQAGSKAEVPGVIVKGEEDPDDYYEDEDDAVPTTQVATVYDLKVSALIYIKSNV